MKSLLHYLANGNAICACLKPKISISIAVAVFFLLGAVRADAKPGISALAVTGLTLSQVTVGSGGNYPTLKAAFDAINAGSVTGNITLQIISSTTETAAPSLNASGVGLANYSSVLIYATGTGYSVSGNISGPLLSLNGADNVVIDGRVNATGSAADLLITNTNTGATACAVRFVNSAESNTIRYATLSASGVGASTAIVLFTSSSSGNGNDNNTIEYCNLTNAGGNRPLNALLSSGSPSRENSGNTIRFNAFYNFFNEASTSYGVNISGSSTDWNITANSFYETMAIVPTAGNTYNAIRIATPTNHTVSGNYIGGSAPLCTGSPLAMNSSFATYFCGIFITGNTTTPSLVQNNTIQNFNYSSTNGNPWDGIYLSMGNVSLLGNTIGAATGTNSVVLTTPSASATATISGGVVTAINLVGGGGGFTSAPIITFTPSGSITPATATATISGGVVTGFTIIDGGSGYTSVPSVNVNGSGYSTSHGIRYLNSGTVLMENNTIGAVTTFGNVAYSHCFEAIVISGIASSVIAINNNLIGSLTTANSIKTASPASSSIYKQDLRGIYVNSAVNLVTITGNTIAHLTSSYTGASISKVDGICTSGASNIIQNNTIRDITGCINSVTVRGIQQTVVTAGTNQSITGNTIYNLSNTHATALVTVVGIDYSGPSSGANMITGNFVHSLTASSTNILSEIDGILLGNGVTTISNNIINLGTGVTTGYKIYGINDNSGASALNNNNTYFNSVYLGGTVTSTATSPTAALWNLNNTTVRNYRNNILMNVRSGGTTGKHYALRIAGSTGLTIDYNDYYCNGGTFSGSFNGVDKTTLALWKTATAQDINSLNTNPLFTVTGGTAPLNYYTSAILTAATGTGITNDYTGLARSVTPKMGALEITAYVWSGAVSANFATASNWQNGLVPPNGSDISFAVSPSNDCVLDQNRVLRNITNNQGTYKLVLNGYRLTLLGSLAFSNNAKIDAITASSVFEFQGSAAQTIPSGAFTGNTIDGFVLNNVAGLTVNDDITIAHPFALTAGALSIGAHTLTLNGIISASSGTFATGSSGNLIINGTGAASLPAVSLNNLTVNRISGIALLGSLSVAGILALTTGILSVGANTLTISGNSPTRVSGAIDANNSDASVVFSNATALTLPASLFATDVNNLTVTGLGGVTSAGDFSLNGLLDLQNSNPSSTKGALDLWDGAVMKTITMGATAVNTGIGDTTGIIKRISFTAGVSYTLGSPFIKVFFNNTGTLPSQLSLKMSIGTVPSWKTGAIAREIEVIQTGAVATSGVVSYHYLDSELNGNNEEDLVLWAKIGNIEYGSSAFNSTENWVSLSNVNVAFFSSAFDGTKNITLDEASTNNTITWNGSVSTSWTTVQNWTPNIGPSATKNITIPDTSTTTYAPVLPSTTDFNSLTIDAGGVLNSVAAAQVTIEGSNAWSNHGGIFNASTSNIKFNNAAATMSGTTNFYDLTINSGKTLSMTTDCNMRIAGSMTNNGTWNTLASGLTFVEYNGGPQTVVNPNGVTAGYSSLILSGSGTKTMASALSTIHGNFILADTVTAAAAAALTVSGNLIIGAGTTFSSGNFNHVINGDFENDGTFNAAAAHDVTLSGTVPQSISGSSTTVFDGLTINNSNGIDLYGTINVNNVLTLTNGSLKIDVAKLRILGTITKTTGFIEVGTLSSLTIGGAGAITLAGDLFSGPTALSNLTINRTGGVTLGQDMTIGGILNITSGTLNIASNNLTVSTDGTITIVAPNAAKMIIADGTGELRKVVASGIPYTFPVGDNNGTAEYSPLTLTLTGENLLGDFIGVNVTNIKHPDNASSTQYLNRYWSIRQSGTNPHTATIAAGYTTADIAGTETGIAAAELTGNFSQSNNPWIKYTAISGNTLAITGLALTNQTTTLTGISGANPTVSLLGAATVCSGSDVSLNTSVTADGTPLYNWTPTDFLSSAFIANPIATNITATTSYTVTIKDGNGISASDTGTISLGNTTTWSGIWSNGAPTSTTAVIIASNYTATASVSCCSLTVNNNAAVVFPSGIDLTLYGALTVSSGSFTLENNANLIQSSNAANSGNIIVRRSSSPLLRQDYTLWSSPVTGQQLQAFSPLTLANRFYDYVSSTNLYATVLPSTDFETAKGYLIRVPNNHPVTPTVWNGSFSGVPHNGNYSYALAVGDATHRFNLVGNPYPSPVSMANFVSDNSNSITGTLYFWRKTNNAASPSYCSWLGGTFVSNGEAQVFDPNGIIRTGQGFFVEAKAGAVSVLFTNTQRSSDNADQFFRTGEAEESHRIWLNATSATGAFSQTELGYVSNATQGLDALDGNYMNDGEIELYSLINAEKLVIQGRALPFDVNDIVPLGFKATSAGTYTIALDHVDGLFTGEQVIFIKDNLSGTVADLKAGAYSFDSAGGIFDTRFEIIYANSLATNSVSMLNNQIVAYKNNGSLVISSAIVPIVSVKVFDSSGKLLAADKTINSLKTNFSAGWSNGLLLIRITLADGSNATRKVLW